MKREEIPPEVFKKWWRMTVCTKKRISSGKCSNGSRQGRTMRISASGLIPKQIIAPKRRAAGSKMVAPAGLLEGACVH